MHHYAWSYGPATTVHMDEKEAAPVGSVWGTVRKACVSQLQEGCDIPNLTLESRQVFTETGPDRRQTLAEPGEEDACVLSAVARD